MHFIRHLPPDWPPFPPVIGPLSPPAPAIIKIDHRVGNHSDNNHFFHDAVGPTLRQSSTERAIIQRFVRIGLLPYSCNAALASVLAAAVQEAQRFWRYRPGTRQCRNHANLPA